MQHPDGVYSFDERQNSAFAISIQRLVAQSVREVKGRFDRAHIFGMKADYATAVRDLIDRLSSSRTRIFDFALNLLSLLGCRHRIRP